MKLRLLLLLAFSLLLTSLSQAQTAAPWCPPGAEWTYGYWGFGLSGTLKMRYSGDTVLAGQPAQIIKNTVINPRFWGFSSPDYSLPPIITKVAGSDVSFWHDGQWVLLYRFGAQPGDTWTTYAASGMGTCPQIPVQVTVDTVGTQVVGGRPVRWLAVHITDGTRTYRWGRLYDGIGGSINFKPTSSRCGHSDPDHVGPLQSFRATGLATVGPTASGGTLSVLATAEARANQAGFAVYPNPTAGLLSLQLPTHMPPTASLLLYDLTGRRVWQQAVPANHKLDLSGLPKGVYLLTLESAGQPPLSRRIVIQ